MKIQQRCATFEIKWHGYLIVHDDPVAIDLSESSPLFNKSTLWRLVRYRPAEIDLDFDDALIANGENLRIAKLMAVCVACFIRDDDSIAYRHDMDKIERLDDLAVGDHPGGAIGAIVVGILGGLLGGWVLDALDVNNNLTWLGSLIVAILGAVVILFALRKVDDGSSGRPIRA